MKVKNPLIRLDEPDFNNEGLAIYHTESVTNPEYQQAVIDVFSRLSPATNSKNKNQRGIRNGFYLGGKFIWNDDDTYQISADLNPEDKGMLRQMTLLPLSFLDRPETLELMKKGFSVLFSEEERKYGSYWVRVTAHLYTADLINTSYGAPDAPHQDGHDSIVNVLSKDDSYIGGISRLYDLDKNPIYQIDLRAGDTIVIRDKEMFHHVTPGTYDPVTALENRAVRAILNFRFGLIKIQ